jgi:hypothetical protein
MILLIFICYLLTVLVCFKLGAEIAARYIYEKRHAINKEDYDYFCSWEFIKNYLKDEL